MAFQEMNEIACAIKDYSKEIKLNPDNAQAHYKRGTARLELKEWEKAKSDLNYSNKTREWTFAISVVSTSKGIPGFEEKVGIKLPEDILVLLTLP